MSADSQLDPDVQAVVQALRDRGDRPVLVVTSDASLPAVVFRSPDLGQLSGYIVQASKEEVGPLMAAIGLARMAVAYPSSAALEQVVATKPFVVMRAVQALLKNLGLSTRAEKKSLS